MKKIPLLIICIFLSIVSDAQVTIYRYGIVADTLPSLFSLSGHVKAGDSIVLSPGVYSFPGAWAEFDTDVVLSGIRTPTDSTVIDNGLIRVKGNAHVTIRDMDIRNYHLEGSAIMGEAGTTITITGHSRLHHNNGDSSAKSTSTLRSSAGAIFSYGTVCIQGNTIIDSNLAPGPGAILDENGIKMSENAIIRGNVSYGGNGGAIYSHGPCEIKGNVIIEGNISIVGRGGGIFAYGDISISGHVQFLYNFASESGGAIYATGNKDILSIKDSVVFSGNKSDYGSAISNEFGSRVSIDGAQFINNGYQDSIPAICATIFLVNTDSLFITNSRIFNHDILGERPTEVMSGSPLFFSSDTCWWGSSDLPWWLISLAVGSTKKLNSWVIANWTLNYGRGVGSASTFPVSASFTLQDSSAILPDLFWMLNGTFNASSGSFSSGKPVMTPGNIITSNYSAGIATAPVIFTCYVDADTFRTTATIAGTTITEIGNSQSFELYPNPSNGDIFIRRQNERIDEIHASLFDVGGREITNVVLRFNNNIAKLSTNVIPGDYLLSITGKDKNEMMATYNVSINR